MVVVQVAGEYAMFSQPAYGKEKHSFLVITPAAAEGILQSIFWKPQFCYTIRKIEIIKPGRIQSMVFNDRDIKGKVLQGGQLIADTAMQRSYALLRDVEYRIHAHISIPEGTSLRPDQNEKSYVSQLLYRIEKGRQYQTPFFGMKEFVADFFPANDTPVSHELDGTILSLPLRTVHGNRQYNSPVEGFSWVQVSINNGGYAVDESRAIVVNRKGEIL